MRVTIRNKNHSQSEKWEEENKNNLIYKAPPKGTPVIEMLLTDPPKFRINGTIVAERDVSRRIL